MHEDKGFAEEIQRFIDTKTKPRGALGRVEKIAARIAALQGTLRPTDTGLGLFLFAADHGIAAEGVSAYPQEVTAQMVLNLLGGGAAANVFSRSVGARLTIVDAGIATEIDHPNLVRRRMGPGTASFLEGPAMPRERCDDAWATGAALAEEAGEGALAFGEMGIANTSAAAILAHKITGRPLEGLIGRGAGLDDAGLARKHEVLARAATRTGALSPADALAEYGGFEIAMMAGAMTGAAGAGKLILVDGYIATSAALVALARAPDLRSTFLFAHRSAEPGHDAMLDHLKAAPILDLGLRLGEGTGALLAWPIVQAAIAMLRDMASFEDAGVRDTGG